MSTQPQTEEYLAARRESCRLLNLNADDLTAHETIRADLLTVLRLWLDSSQSTLIAGGTADPSKILAVADVLGRLVPEPEHRGRREDPRQKMLEIYLQMRRNGEVPPEGWLQAKINAQSAEIERLKAELAALKAGPPAEPAPQPPAGGNVVTLSRPATERTSERSVVSPSPPAASAPVFGNLVCDPSPEEPWRDYVEPDGSIRTTPRGPGRYWGPV